MTPKNAEELEADLWWRTMEMRTWRHDITREQIRAVLTALRDAGVALVDAEAWKNVRFVHDTFKCDLERGYRTKDKVFAVDLLGKALAARPYEEG